MTMIRRYATLMGGLYDWNTTMNKSTTEGTHGICPSGWHVPKDSEWYVLENGLTDTGKTCDANRSGPDCETAGAKLKVGDTSGFNAILTGGRGPQSLFENRGEYATFWSSTESSIYAWVRFISSGNPALITTDNKVMRATDDKVIGSSVRCLKD